MKSFRCYAIAGAVGAAMALSGGAAFAVNDEPLTDNWAPTEWGADDMVGAPLTTFPRLSMVTDRFSTRVPMSRG